MTARQTTLSKPEKKALRFASVAIAALGGGGLFFGQANPIFHCPPLVVLFPACLAALGLLAPSDKNAFYSGWLCGIIGNSLCLYWIAVPLHYFGLVPWALTAPIVMALGAFLGLYSALFTLGMRLFRARLPFPVPILLSFFLWTTLEYAKAWIFTGFPWICLATAFVPWPVWTQMASVIGSHALSGIFAMVGVALLEAFPPRAGYTTSVPRRKKIQALGLALLAIGSIYAHGLTVLSSPPLHGREIRVALVQGNVDQNQKWAPEYQRGTVARYLSLSESAVDPALGKVGKPVDLLIWPETAMPFYVETNTMLSERIFSFAERYQVSLAFGAPGKNADASAGGYHNRLWFYTPASLTLLPSSPEPANTAAVYGGKGSLVHYDKNHLVPFGEYVPLSIPIPFIEYLMQGVDFRPGQDSKILHSGDIALGGLICYEAIFPQLARQRALDGANLLLNISNDAWFGLTSAPVQHLYLSAMRAVETGRYVVRATNTGISAIIDQHGRITAYGGFFKAQVVIGEAHLLAHNTVYGLTAPYIMWGTLLVAFAAVAFCFACQRRAEP